MLIYQNNFISNNNYKDDIAFFKRKGLIIRDEEQFINNYKFIGKERLVRYGIFYEDTNKNYQNADDEAMFLLVFFDEFLKTHIFSMLSKIEIAFRERWSCVLSIEHGILAYKNEALYKNKVNFYQSIARLFQDIEQSKDEEIIALKKLHSIELLPNSIIKDVFSFGQISKHFGNLAVKSTSDSIASEFCIEGEMLKSWLNHLVEVRNIIAHHNILWNRKLSTQPIFPKNKPHSLVQVFNPKTRQIYNALVILTHFAEIFNMTDWIVKLQNMLFRFNGLLPYMGFQSERLDNPLFQKFKKLQEIP